MAGQAFRRTQRCTGLRASSSSTIATFRLSRTPSRTDFHRIEELQPTRHASLEDDVRVLDAARQLSCGRDPVAAFAILDHLDLARGEVNLAEAAGLDALEFDDELKLA